MGLVLVGQHATGSLDWRLRLKGLEFALSPEDRYGSAMGGGHSSATTAWAISPPMLRFVSGFHPCVYESQLHQTR